jgi:hypothetical protein
MSTSSERVQSKNESSNSLASRRVLAHLFREFERARNERDASESRMSRFVETIHLILQTLPDSEKQEYSNRFSEIRNGTSSQNRGGEVFGNVIALFKQDHRSEWTISEVETSLLNKGTSPDPKALHNAIGYLAKTGRLRRLSRGRYLVTDIGLGIETGVDMENINDGTSRVTEHDI